MFAIRRSMFAASAAASAAVMSVAIAKKPRQTECIWGPNKMSKDAISKAKADIIAAIEAEDEKRDDGTSIGPTLIRLAWHASGTYSVHDKTGGSNGATMRFSPEKDWGANAGLGGARAFMEPIAKRNGMSMADAWTLAGVAAIENMGGPAIPWRSGRTDSSSPTKVPDGRLPDADKGSPAKTNSHLRDIFYKMGFNDREIVALSGAHAIGRCHENATGYWGPWTFAETTFSNEYYRLLLEEKWTVKKTHNGKKWTGPMQYEVNLSLDHSCLLFSYALICTVILISTKLLTFF